MNAHNEQQPAEMLARRFHEAYERLAPSFGYETRTESRQFDPASKNGRLMIAVCAELAPAAAQEVVAWQWRCPRADTDWSDCDKSLYDELRKAIGGEAGEMNGLRYEVRALYAAPVTAAPVDLHAHLLHMLGAKDHEDAGRIIGELHAATMRTPAAPVAIFQERSTHSVYRGSCGSLPCYCWAASDHIIGDEVKRYSTPAAPGIGLADISLAAQMLTWGREDGLTEGQIAEVDAHQKKLFALIDASPKGGSDASVSPWKPISELPISDDLFWFARGDTVDGPRPPQAGGYDADEWNWFAPAEAPDFTPKMDAERDQHHAELNKAQAGDAEVQP